MNAPHICKLRNGVNKTLSFFFSTSKGRIKTIARLSIGEGWIFWSLDRRIYNCKLWNEKKYLIQMHNEYSLEISKLLHNGQSKNKEAL